MRLVVVLMLALVAFTVTVVASPPIGWTEEGLTNMLRDMLNREPTTQDIENAKSGQADKMFRQYLEKLERDHPTTPETTSLRRPTRPELRDLATAEFVNDDAVVRGMGYQFANQGFVGRTQGGRLVFDAPRRRYFSLQIPDSNHIWTESLTAREDGHGRGYLQHHGWFRSLGFGPWDELRDIAIRSDRGEYLLKDRVPVNRMTILRHDQMQPHGSGLQLGPPLRTSLRAEPYDGPSTQGR